MDLKRYFRGPFVAVLVMLLLFFIVFTYANRGTPYTQTDTSKVVSLIQQGKVTQATITDKNQTIQITTTGGQRYQASWVTGQGLHLQQELQAQAQAAISRMATTWSCPAAVRCWT